MPEKGSHPPNGETALIATKVEVPAEEMGLVVEASQATSAPEVARARNRPPSSQVGRGLLVTDVGMMFETIDVEVPIRGLLSRSTPVNATVWQILTPEEPWPLPPVAPSHGQALHALVLNERENSATGGLPVARGEAATAKRGCEFHGVRFCFP